MRSPERAQITSVLASTLGLHCEVALFDQLPSEAPHWVISTLPGGVVPEASGLERAAETAHLFDIAYDPWPSALARLWSETEQITVSGLPMLAYQALAQVRAFVGGDSSRPLDHEDDVRRAMWGTVGPGPGAQPAVKQ